MLFYHASADPKAVVGTATVVKAGYPDPTQFNRPHKYYDPKSNSDEPRWYVVDIKAEKAFKRPVTLEEMRGVAELNNMRLLQRGQRLSVMPVSAAEYRVVVRLGSRGVVS